MKNRIKVYVAGPYSGDNVLDVLRNIGRGEKACAELFKLGFAPFCPWHDKSYVMDNPDHDFSMDDFYSYSLAWLEVSNAMLVLENWGDSYGTTQEINRAKELKIPVFYSIEDLLVFDTYFKNIVDFRNETDEGVCLHSLEDLLKYNSFVKGEKSK